MTVPVIFATDGLFLTAPNDTTSETADVRWLFQVNVAVPFATTVFVAVIWVISSVQFEAFANFTVAVIVALFTEPWHPVSLAPLIDTDDRTSVESPSFGSPGVSRVVPLKEAHVVPAAAPAAGA